MADNTQFIDIEQEYEKHSNLKREDVETLRKFAETLRRKPSDVLLFLMLHSCYYDVEKAKKTITSYYKLRAKWPEVFKGRNPNIQPLRDQFDIGLVWPFRQRTKEGYHILYNTFINSDPDVYDLELQCKLFFLIVDFWLSITGNCPGSVVIFDTKDLSWGHLAKFTISGAKKLMEYVQEGLPVRLKAIHYVNTGVILEKILIIVRMFMNKELQNIIHVHATMDSLYEYIPKRCLPKELGGDDLTVQDLREDMLQTIFKNAALLEKDEEEPTDAVEKFTYFEAL